jgi:hypothetical protein
LLFFVSSRSERCTKHEIYHQQYTLWPQQRR